MLQRSVAVRPRVKVVLFVALLLGLGLAYYTFNAPESLGPETTPTLEPATRPQPPTEPETKPQPEPSTEPEPGPEPPEPPEMAIFDDAVRNPNNKNNPDGLYSVVSIFSTL